ncbi:MAG: ABC-type dipeptide/oligopeptide/nickel transport system, permease component [Aeromicrobium sp.]|nr:ABC-type dipeptide/oligopeptide/nickel transport system, permease component [Aeromicrobium sp.]
MTLVATVAAPAEGAGARARSLAGVVITRVGTSLLVIWGAITATFVALHAGKGEVIDAITGSAQVSPAVRQQIIDDYRLDDPLIVQYLHYLGRLVQGDLGQSYSLRMPVARAIGQQIVPTVQLIAVASVLSLVVAVVVALATANRSRRVRGPVSSVEVVLVALPSFWFGILLLTFFSFKLQWFPSVGSEGLSSLVLPSIALAAAPAALLSQVLRHGLERTSDEPFVLTARTRGLSSQAVLVRHVLRHAAAPTITLWGWITGALISGAVVIEQVFSREGLGRLTVTAINGKDFPLVIGIVIIAATFYTLVNTLIDAAYAWIDPRLRTESRPVRRTSSELEATP